MLNTHHFTNKANPISPLQHRINKAIETRDFWARRLEHKQDMSLRQKLASEMILLSLDKYVELISRGSSDMAKQRLLVYG